MLNQDIYRLGYSGVEEGDEEIARKFSRDAAKRGANLLDEKVIGWADRIDTDDLDMRNIYQCIIGQLADQSYEPRAFECYCLKLGLDDETDTYVVEHEHEGTHILSEDVPATSYYGFESDSEFGSYDLLEEYWTLEIKERTQ